MTSRNVIQCALSIPLLLCVACGSKPPAQKTSSLSPSAEQGQPAPAQASQPEQPAAAAPAQKQEEKTFSYATNPERFGKQKTYQPPFNIIDPKTDQEYFNVGVDADNHTQLDKAIQAYEKALELKPDWAIAHFRLAMDLHKQGREDDAIAHWEEATKQDPQYYVAYDYLSAAYQRQGNIKKAIEAYSALLKYPPAQMLAHYQIGLWYAEIGDRENARQHLESYRQLALQSKEQESERFQKALLALRKLQ